MTFVVLSEEFALMHFWHNAGYLSAQADYEDGMWEPEKHLAYAEFCQDLVWAKDGDRLRSWYQWMKPYLRAAYEKGYELYGTEVDQKA